MMANGPKGQSVTKDHGVDITEDVKILHSMGYAQELSRRMSGFSNFAISFSIICILAGGITSFQLGFSAARGASLGIGSPPSRALSLILPPPMGQMRPRQPPPRPAQPL